MGIFKKNNENKNANETPKREKVIFHEGHRPSRPQKTCDQECRDRADKFKREVPWWAR